MSTTKLPSDGTDLTLLVDGGSIPVHRVVLCMVSPVFKTMLSGKFKERNAQSVKLPGKKYRYANMVLFLEHIYPTSETPKEVTEESAYLLLSLADEYQVIWLRTKCGKYLTELVRGKRSTDAKYYLDHLYLADRYCLDDLEQACACLLVGFKMINIIGSEGFKKVGQKARSTLWQARSRHYELKCMSIPFIKDMATIIERNIVTTQEGFGSKCQACKAAHTPLVGRCGATFQYFCPACRDKCQKFVNCVRSTW